MKRILSLILATVMLLAAFTSCDGGDKETTTADNDGTTTTVDNGTTTTTEDISDGTTTTGEGNLPTTDPANEITTTNPAGETTTTSTTGSETTADDSWKEGLIYQNGILKSYIGAFTAFTVEADAANSYKITANDFMEYDATVIIFFTMTCGYCKSMIKEVLQPYYEQYGENVLVLGVLYTNNPTSDSKSLATWKQQNGITFPMVIANGANGFVFASSPQSGGLGSLGGGVPQTYILDRTGAYYSGFYGYAKNSFTKIYQQVILMKAGY